MGWPQWTMVGVLVAMSIADLHRMTAKEVKPLGPRLIAFRIPFRWLWTYLLLSAGGFW